MTLSSPSPADDIPRDHWIDRLAPKTARPYLRLIRLDRPIGAWLLLFPCWWSIALAADGGWPDWSLLTLFAVGALVMRGAGCIINDLADRDYDGRVARTASRPIASGAISVLQALMFLAALLLLGLVILVQLNWTTIWIGVAALPLVVIYPFAKRYTYWPQAVLGVTFNFGALMGWTAVRGELGWPAVLLYLGCLAWTLGYDTIYAHQDKADDARIGIKSTALKFGRSTAYWVVAFYAAAAAFFGLAGAAAGLSWPFFVLLAAAVGQLAWQIAAVDLDVAQDCLAKFKSNRLVGWLLLSGLVLGNIA
jgi:4-hydroxybenzoate polyprenyltransferase